MAEVTGVVHERPARFQLLDYLRFVAAAMVVLMHYLVNGIANGKVTSLSPNEWAIPWAKYGYLGVWLFFLISGFVITKSARGKTAREFVVSRAVRLYPAFWVALAFTSVVALLLANDQMAVDLHQIAVNTTMVPTELGESLVDGAYWTLVYELKFYLLILAFLFFGGGKWLDAFFPIWTVAMVALSIASPANAAIVTYGGGYFLLFACGALIASIRDFGPTWYRVIPLLLGWTMSVRFARNEASQFLAHKGTAVSPDVVAVILTLFFVAILAMCVPRIARLHLPHSRAIGALTYPVYLLHAHVGYMVLNHVATDSTKWLVYPTLIASLIALGAGLHWLVETGPRLEWWKGFFDRTAGALIERIQPRGLRKSRRRATRPPAPQAHRTAA